MRKFRNKTIRHVKTKTNNKKVNKKVNKKMKKKEDKKVNKKEDKKTKINNKDLSIKNKLYQKFETIDDSNLNKYFELLGISDNNCHIMEKINRISEKSEGVDILDIEHGKRKKI